MSRLIDLLPEPYRSDSLALDDEHRLRKYLDAVREACIEALHLTREYDASEPLSRFVNERCSELDGAMAAIHPDGPDAYWEVP